MKVAAKDYLSQTSLLRLLAVLALVVAPHLTRMPPWLDAVVICIGVWRAVAALRQWPLPPVWLNWIMALAAIASVGATYGQISGQHAGTALLVIMVALKLTEMRSRRDVLVVVSLCYFTMITHFLFSQEIWTITYLLGCAVAVTSILIEANHAGEPLPLRVMLKQGAVMVLHALPLMVVLFILFPRVPGPLWGLPSDAGAARTGMANSMEPGDIAKLIESDEVAFRVRFLSDPPPMKERYWRGPVFVNFDGRRWTSPFNGDDYYAFYRRGSRLAAYDPPQADLLGGAVRYEVTLEPHRQNWLFGLDLPAMDALPEGAGLTGYYQLLSVELVKDRRVYTATSYTRFRLQPQMSDGGVRIATRLPEGRNPRALALAQQWRAQGGDEFDIANRALKMFREQKFYYTLSPPKLGADMVDEFLFETRRGFCEHYAGAFTVLMRAAGIPARVVAGYQGGEQNALGDYFVVRQSDAHAWSEIWVKDRGWVRVDPTAAVAPSRIESGISAALASSEVPSFLRRSGSGLWYWRLQASNAWDWVSVRWDRWVLAYSPDKQLALLSHVGLGDWQNMVLALTVLLTVFMSIVGLLVLRQSRPAQPPDFALRLWQRAVKHLAKAGFAQQPAEGPLDYAARVARERPELASVMQRLLGAYLSARYLGIAEPKAAEAELTLALKALKA